MHDPASKDQPTALERVLVEQDALMVAAAAGCQVSFSKLYLLTHRRLLSSILRLVQRRAQAEELLQDVYVKAWQKRAQFEIRRGHAMHWLTRIARRTAIDSLRAARARPLERTAEGDDEESYQAQASPAKTPLESYAAKQRSEQILGGINSLPDHYRDSVRMAFLEDLTHDEIARVQGSPVGTVKSRIRRGLQALREVLTEMRRRPEGHN